MQEKNQILFLTIAEGKLYKAQKLLQKAALQDPCGVSYQNLGVFYAKEGLQLRSGRGRRADHLARHWLEKAMQINDTKGILYKFTVVPIAIFQIDTSFVLAVFQFLHRRCIGVEIVIRNTFHMVECFHHRVVYIQLPHVR